MKSIFWEIISSEDRIAGINHIKAVVDRYGSIMEFKKFSDLSMSLIIEMNSTDLDPFRNRLKEVASIMSESAEDMIPGQEIMLYLNITFAHGTGDLRHEIPDFPE